MLPHAAVIANVIQTAVFLRVNDPADKWENKRYRPGDVSLGVLPMFRALFLLVSVYDGLCH